MQNIQYVENMLGNYKSFKILLSLCGSFIFSFPPYIELFVSTILKSSLLFTFSGLCSLPASGFRCSISPSPLPGATSAK